MRVGVAVFPREMKESVSAAVAMVALAESAGFSDVWIPDTQGIWKDPYVVMALAAIKTRSITLGLGVTNPITRHPMVTARSILTIQEVCQGRAILGIGAGDTSVKALATKPATVARCAEYVRVVRSLLDGKDVVHDGATLRLENIGDHGRIPIYLAANGPAMLRLAGEVADGVIVPTGLTPAYPEYVMTHVGEGLRAAGRRPADIDVCFLAGCSLSPDRERARQEAKAYVAKRALVPVPSEISGISESEKERFVKAYRFQEHMQVGARHGDLVPESWIDRFALAGTPDEVREKVAALASWGADHLLVLPVTEDTAYLITELGKTVVAPVARGGRGVREPGDRRTVPGKGVER